MKLSGIQVWVHGIPGVERKRLGGASVCVAGTLVAEQRRPCSIVDAALI